MKPLSVALLQSDAKTFAALSTSLGRHFHAIHRAESLGELRETILKHRLQTVVIDLEIASFSDIEQLHQEFAHITIVCTHRLADEQMWTAALNAGAADIYSAVETESIVAAAMRNCAHLADCAAA